MANGDRARGTKVAIGAVPRVANAFAAFGQCLARRGPWGPRGICAGNEFSSSPPIRDFPDRVQGLRSPHHYPAKGKSGRREPRRVISATVRLIQRVRHASGPSFFSLPLKLSRGQTVVRFVAGNGIDVTLVVRTFESVARNQLALRTTFIIFLSNVKRGCWSVYLARGDTSCAEG